MKDISKDEFPSGLTIPNHPSEFNEFIKDSNPSFYGSLSKKDIYLIKLINAFLYDKQHDMCLRINGYIHDTVNKLIEVTQKWVVEEYSKELQNWLVEYYYEFIEESVKGENDTFTEISDETKNRLMNDYTSKAEEVIKNNPFKFEDNINIYR